MSLLDLPHHDGSPSYVDDEAPSLGDAVTVRVRTSTEDPVDAVWLRTTSSVFDLLQNTLDSGERELRLIASQDAFAQPRMQFEVTQVR